MNEVDADKDGVISFEEFKDCMFDILTKRASFINQ
jgi:Ca2+-binding EF-hand superfamily protein